MQDYDIASSELVNFYENCLRVHGRKPEGLDWPNAKDLEKRYEIMLSFVENRASDIKILDLGCGPGLLLDYLKQRHATKGLIYNGVDISNSMIREALKRWPEEKFECRDFLKNKYAKNEFDNVLMNGLFTKKQSLPEHVMKKFLQTTIVEAFRICKQSITFNVMSTHVDWTREDLYHVPLDDLAEFLTREVSRHFIIRNDYGLYEYTVHVKRFP